MFTVNHDRSRIRVQPEGLPIITDTCHRWQRTKKAQLSNQVKDLGWRHRHQPTKAKQKSLATTKQETSSTQATDHPNIPSQL